VKDLPLPFVLDDSMAMSPSGKLSMHPRVVLEARISKSGQTQASAGDLVARSAPLAHDAQGVVVEIAEVQK
jgi:cytochrome c-type biogenesis protein CcmH